MSSVSYQIQKIHNVEKTNEGRDWYLELPSIIKDKFDNYRTITRNSLES
ncbi:MAG: hypothetical protein OPY08_01870 [Nitrosopumilus sp.]|nr:hypothetical protein [Nitrosopumilus sp.]MDF2424379.1 hypothetical protein [Nitrosopumilus sp.]MDF2425167.1 hypothetical protein [Nitrosopumilus sp.]MDF2427234.1 hypothetical protein [Nitrosopumilus sp.]MDF2427662.1 hypothetical protein [Nitrosopumilus sp.]